MMIDPDEMMLEDIIDWFKSKHTTMWGQTFTVTDDDRALVAARWFRTELKDYAQHRYKGAREAVVTEEQLHPNLYEIPTVEGYKAHDEELGIMLTSVFWKPPTGDPEPVDLGHPRFIHG